MKQSFAEIVAEARRQRGMTFTKIEALSGINAGHACRIEHGSIDPSMRTAMKLCEALELDFADVAGRMCGARRREEQGEPA